MKQREIKFRAYHTGAKEMLYGANVDIFRWLEEDRPIEIMQFSGLLDKNGKEIYEGDLLRIPSMSDYEINNYVCFEVFWHDNDHADRHIGFQLNRVHLHGSLAGYGGAECMLPKWTKQMEIIGNIYENPELLK